MIDQKKLENDLQYIAETDVEYAELTAKLSKEVHDLKHIKGKYISITNADIPVSKAQEKFFSTDEFKNYNKKLCDLDVLPCEPSSTKKDLLAEMYYIRTLIDAAKAKVEYCQSPNEGMELYNFAKKKLKKITCDICC